MKHKRERIPQHFSSRGANSGNFGSSQCPNVSNGLTQTEKAYTILKKELSRNPQDAPDPREFSWTTPISVNSVLKVQNSLQGEQVVTISRTLQENTVQNMLPEMTIPGWSRPEESSQPTSSASSDEDLETDGGSYYDPWSTFDWSSQAIKHDKQDEKKCEYSGTNLFDWFHRAKQEEYRRFSVNDIDEFIPFDPPIVSRFGPISRVARSKMKNSDPVIVTADEAITKMTPVTAVTPMQRPYPASAPAPSRYQLPGEPTEVLAPRPKTRSSEPHTLWHRHTTAPYGNNQLRQELNRLEQNATGASTADERLAYELQAIELKISMKTGKRPDPVEQPDISRMEAPCNINLIPTSVSTHRQQTTTLHRALEAQVERGDELIYKQHQEEQDRQLAQKLMMEELQSNRQTHK